MYHTIEFTGDRTLDLEVSPRQPLQRLRIHKGTVCKRRSSPMWRKPKMVP
jgi:hypothetical protein